MLAFRKRPASAPIDPVPALRTAFTDVFRDRATILTNRDVREIWDRHVDAPHPVIRQVRALDDMLRAVHYLRDHSEQDHLRIMGMPIANVVLDPLSQHLEHA